MTELEGEGTRRETQTEGDRHRERLGEGVAERRERE
jgi:hypothetical protein